MKTAHLISNIEEYGKLLSFLISNDVNVYRLYWNEQEKGDRCYRIDWQEKRCYYSSRRYYENEDYEIVTPTFLLDKYGEYKIVNREVQSDE